MYPTSERAGERLFSCFLSFLNQLSDNKNFVRQSEDYDTLLVFECFSYRSCKSLWKCCVENHAFFRLRAPPPPNLPTLALFGFGSRFHYTGKTEYQTREDASRSIKSRRTFFRSQSKRVKQATPLMDSRRQINDDEADCIINGDYNGKENGKHWDGRSLINGDCSVSNTALEAYGIVSLKESKIDSWTNNKNGGIGCARNGDRPKLSLPIDSNNRTGNRQEPPRMAWAEQSLSDEYVKDVSFISLTSNPKTFACVLFQRGRIC